MNDKPRRRASDFMAESFEQGFLPAIFEAISEVILFVQIENNTTHRFVTANTAFFDHTGFRHTDVVGKTLDAILPAHQYERLAKHIAEAIVYKKNTLYITHDLVTNKPQFEISITPIFNHLDQCDYVVAVSRNIEHRKATSHDD